MALSVAEWGRSTEGYKICKGIMILCLNERKIHRKYSLKVFPEAFVSNSAVESVHLTPVIHITVVNPVPAESICETVTIIRVFKK